MKDYRAPPSLLADRVVLVTGAAKGIGRAAATAFAAHGAAVILLDRSRAALEDVYDDIESRGSAKPAMIQCDLATAGVDDYAAVAQTLEDEFGRLDGLMHNAAELGVLAPIEHYEPAVWSTVMQVNLTSAFLLTRACLPLLDRTGDASIVFTTADVARQARAYWGAYAAAGFALEGLAQVLAEELAGNARIRVNTIDPGAVRTDFRARAYPAEDASLLPSPQAIIGTYLYLLGPDSRGVSGRKFTAGRATASS